MVGPDALERLAPVLRQHGPGDARVVLEHWAFSTSPASCRPSSRRSRRRGSASGARRGRRAGAGCSSARERCMRLRSRSSSARRGVAPRLELTPQQRCAPASAGRRSSSSNSLWTQYLTTQCLSSILLRTQVSVHDEPEESNEHQQQQTTRDSGRHLDPRSRPLEHRLRGQAQQASRRSAARSTSSTRSSSTAGSRARRRSRASRSRTRTSPGTCRRPTSSTPSSSPSSASSRSRSSGTATASRSHGDLTIRGVTKPVELAGTIAGPLENALRHSSGSASTSRRPSTATTSA